MYVCIMCQCFGVGISYGSWLGLTIPAYGWDVTLPSEVFAWKTALGQGRTRLDSLIVIAKGSHSCFLCDSCVSCCQVIFPSDMGEACSLISNVDMRRCDGVMRISWMALTIL
jgi:hypothetical protein